MRSKLLEYPEGDATPCTYHMSTGGYLVRVAPHMHLLGVGFTMVLNPGSSPTMFELRYEACGRPWR